MCRRRLGIAACASTALAIALLGAPRSMRAADDFDKVHAEAGRLWYDKYRTPCHGPAGVPGTAVYADTRKPVDLRNYSQRNSGKFPAARWIAVVTTDNPTQLHTEVWYRIRDAQGGVAFADAGGRAVVASIASYIRSIPE
jgi:hypothetical protein